MLNQYYILYLDILGYKEHVAQNQEGFLEQINDTMKKATEKKWPFFTIRIFSDNIIVCAEKEDDNLRKICHYASRLQEIIFRAHGIMVRGGITQGELYIDSKYVYGKGLIRAVNLEGEAKYPRIIIDEQLKEEKYIKESNYTIEQDKDKRLYINFLNYYHPNICGTRERNKAKLICSYNNIISEKTSTAKNKRIRDVIKIKQKKRWLKKYFNKHLKEYGLNK